MGKLKNYPEKLCSFYISEWHLATMLLPYINKEINEKANIITELENDITENIKTLISKLNLKNEKKILNINWKKSQREDKEQIFNKIRKLKKGKNIILISGKKEYIDRINLYIEDSLGKVSDNLDNSQIKIINCYEITDFNGNIKEILDIHDKILNTSGEKKIEDVFEGYIGKEAI